MREVEVIECYSMLAYHLKCLGFDSKSKICQYNDNDVKMGANLIFQVPFISKYLRLLTLFNIIQ